MGAEPLCDCEDAFLWVSSPQTVFTVREGGAVKVAAVDVDSLVN